MTEHSEKEKPYAVLRFLAEMTQALAWPTLVLTALLLFRADFSQLFKRTKTLEIAGAKSEFIDTSGAIGYVQGKLTELAATPDARDREQLREEIEKTTRTLGGLHPLALSMLIQLGEGILGSSAWADKQKYLDQLLSKKLIMSVDYAPNNPHESNSIPQFVVTPLGEEFLDSIGYTNRHTFGKSSP